MLFTNLWNGDILHFILWFVVVSYFVKILYVPFMIIFVGDDYLFAMSVPFSTP